MTSHHQMTSWDQFYLGNVSLSLKEKCQLHLGFHRQHFFFLSNYPLICYPWGPYCVYSALICLGLLSVNVLYSAVGQAVGLVLLYKLQCCFVELHSRVFFQPEGPIFGATYPFAQMVHDLTTVSFIFDIGRFRDQPHFSNI